MIRFFIQGTPKSMSVGTSFGFKRNGVQHHMQGRRNTEWATLVGQIGREHAPPVPYQGGVFLTLRFWLRRPATLTKRVLLPLKRPDIDNLIHKLSDQWNGVFWVDDSQITDVVISKRFAVNGRTGVEICVEPVHLPEIVVPQQQTFTTAPA